jgi:cytochrome c oxidase cbb3-type subunit 2
LAWLVAGNAVGLWLSLLLLFPGLNAGGLTYGRWVPVHLNVQLYGWTALPLAGWLMGLYDVPRRWAHAATWAWSAALAVGAISWLAGRTSGKIFLDWQGGPRVAFVAALGFLWVVLAAGWWRHRGRWSAGKRRASLGGLAGLAAVPWALWQASSADLYPPVDPSTGGPTGASLLGSTLVVVGLLLLLPRACALDRKQPGLRPRGTMGYFIACWVVFAAAEIAGGSHHDALQIGALALLLPWPWLVLRDWRCFRWPDAPHGWCIATLLWWLLLVASGWVAFLPGVLDRLKFTHGLVAHSHLAMAGFTTSFCALLLRLTGHRFGRLSSALAWNLAALAMVAVLAATGWREGAGIGWMVDAPLERSAALVIRALCGLVMLAASLQWWWSWRPGPEQAEILSDEENDRVVLEFGRRRDGRRDRAVVDLHPVEGDDSAWHSPPPGRSGAVHGLDRHLRAFHGAELRPLDPWGHHGGDRVDDHGDRAHGGRLLSRRANRRRRAAGGLVGGGGGGRRGGGGAGGRPEGRLVAGLSLPLRAAAAVALAYAHFLIFAQFAWVELMRAAGVGPAAERTALGAMAAAGIAAGFTVARRNLTPALLRGGFVAAAAAAVLSPWATAFPAVLAVSLLSGAGIGATTVALATLLPRWCGIGWVGLGTGAGYALCNLPPVFLSTPAAQAALGAMFALAGAVLVPRRTAPLRPAAATGTGGWVRPIAAFTALVWLDSAAFFIIQHERDLKAATWGEPLLWRNAVVHFAAALAAGALLRRGGFAGMLAAAWAILAAAAIAVDAAPTRGLAGWLYPAGVSLYSTALVAWPGFLASATDSRGIARRAAWLFAVAGWFGSANGIGMVQTLHHVPAAFIGAAGLVVIGALWLGKSRWRSTAAVAVVVWLAALPASPPPTDDRVARGRAVYLAEGCIHCHSRYVRPGSADEIPWGPASDAAETLRERPVLIGNRRQGPDLARVGARRSAAWLKLHFIDPRAFAPDSPMPSYQHLFRDGRGDDLIAYLREVPADAVAARLRVALAWSPTADLPQRDGARLFQRHCAICHGAAGHGDGRFARLLGKLPTDLDRGPFAWSAAGAALDLRLARVIKFGLPGTDMPGHELLDDAEVMALVRHVRALRQPAAGP